MYNYVIKTCDTSLDLIRSRDDPLLDNIRLFIHSNLGILVNVKQNKQQVLSDIETLYKQRKKIIEDNNLTILQMELQGKDRNNIETREHIRSFILKHYNINLSDLNPKLDNNDILDQMISLKYCSISK